MSSGTSSKGIKGNLYDSITRDGSYLFITDATIAISGTTGAASGNTASATPTFTGTVGTTESATPTFTGSSGTTGSNGSGTSFSILPPYVVEYCFERTA